MAEVTAIARASDNDPGPRSTPHSESESAQLRAALGRSERLRHAYEEILLTMGSSLGVQELLDKIVGIVSVAVQSTGAYLYLWDAETERLVLRATTEGDKRQYLNTIHLRLGEGLLGWVAQEREAALVEDDVLKDPRWKGFGELQEERFKSALAVPILLDKTERVGVIGLWSRRRAHFGIEHLELLGELAPVLAEVIGRTRRDEDTQRRSQVLSILGDVWARFSMPLPTEQLLEGIAESTAGVMEADVCAIALMNEEGRFVLKGIAPASGDFLSNSADAAGVAPADDSFRRLAMILADRFEEAVSAPLLAGSSHLGFISCYRQRRFATEDRELLSLIAGQLAFGLHSKEARTTETDEASALMNLLASGKSETAAIGVAAALGVDLTKPHMLLHGRLLPKGGKEQADSLAEQSMAAAETFIRGAAAASAHPVVFQRFPGALLGLMRVSAAQDGAALQRSLQTVSAEVGKRHSVAVSVGLSTVQEGPIGYADAYREAAEALEIGSKVRGEGHVVRFDELGPYVYLFRIAGDPRASRDPWMKSLLPLTQHDSRKHTELLETLDAYLDCGGNATLTAERLYLHRNTLRQRLARVEAITKIDLTRTEDWLPLHFAVKLARLRKVPQ